MLYNGSSVMVAARPRKPQSLILFKDAFWKDSTCPGVSSSDKTLCLVQNVHLALEQFGVSGSLPTTKTLDSRYSSDSSCSFFLCPSCSCLYIPIDLPRYLVTKIASLNFQPCESVSNIPPNLSQIYTKSTSSHRRTGNSPHTFHDFRS